MGQYSASDPGRGGTSLLEANGDVPLDGVAFLRLMPISQKKLAGTL